MPITADPQQNQVKFRPAHSRRGFIGEQRRVVVRGGFRIHLPLDPINLRFWNTHSLKERLVRLPEVGT